MGNNSNDRMIDLPFCCGQILHFSFKYHILSKHFEIFGEIIWKWIVQQDFNMLASYSRTGRRKENQRGVDKTNL